MAVRLADLPRPLADAVLRARTRVRLIHTERAVSSLVDPEVGEWVQDAIRSGDLASAIDEVVASDPDLAS